MYSMEVTKMTSQAEKIENAYNKLSEAVAELIEAEHDGDYTGIDIDIAAGNTGLYVEVEYKEMLKEKIKQQKEQQEKEQMYKIKS